MTPERLDEIEARHTRAVLGPLPPDAADVWMAVPDLIVRLREARAENARLREAHPACTWEADHQRRHLEALGLAEEFEWGCDAIEHVGEALLVARQSLTGLVAAHQEAVRRWAQAEAEHLYAAAVGRCRPRLGRYVDSLPCRCHDKETCGCAGLRGHGQCSECGATTDHCPCGCGC